MPTVGLVLRLMRRNGSVRCGMGCSRIVYSVRIGPPQPKFLLCQSLPQTLQPSEFVIFVAAEDVEDSSSYSEFSADAPVDHFRFAPSGIEPSPGGQRFQ
jgi:hypothetical protein